MKHFFTLFLLLAGCFLHSELTAQTLKSVDNSQNSGKVEWLDRQIAAGNSPFGQPVFRTFRFKNISSENLLILQVKSTCPCIVAEWDRNPVEPGQSGTIKVVYDGQKEGDFYRIISVTTNFDSAQPVPLAIAGKVDKKPEASTGN